MERLKSKNKKVTFRMTSILKFGLDFVFLLFAFLFFMLPVNVTGADNKGPQTFHVTKKPEIQQVKPKKPVKIKLHRNANGEYTWDLTGDSVDEIVRADTRLKKLLKLE